MGASLSSQPVALLGLGPHGEKLQIAPVHFLGAVYVEDACQEVCDGKTGALGGRFAENAAISSAVLPSLFNADKASYW